MAQEFKPELAGATVPFKESMLLNLRRQKAILEERAMMTDRLISLVITCPEVAVFMEIMQEIQIPQKPAQ